MATFDTYRDKYRHIRLTRHDGILELCVHTAGDSLVWAGPPHEELGHCFADIAGDIDNQVVIITGAGKDFCADIDLSQFPEVTPRFFLDLWHEARRLLDNLLAINVPVIGAVNGRAHVHAELALLSNIVVASETASFQDAPHFANGVVPGDGVHIVWPMLLGPTRGSYFLLTNEIIDAAKARDLGIVNEVVPFDQLHARAWELAEAIAAKPIMARHFSRTLLTHEMKRQMHEQLSHGFALEGLGMFGMGAD
jgi:enoyl-CoA hydratase/carnithine racemase